MDEDDEAIKIMCWAVFFLFGCRYFGDGVGLLSRLELVGMDLSPQMTD